MFLETLWIFGLVNLLTLSIISTAGVDETTVSMTGETSNIVSNSITNLSRNITVVNKFYFSCDLHWVKSHDNIASSILAARIPALSSVTIISYPLHRFIATVSDTSLYDKPDILADILIINGFDAYELGHIRLSRDVSSVVSPLTAQNKDFHMAAKFKSLYPYKLAQYWSAGGNVAARGFLQMNKESTIATHEGHVFFLTLADNRSHEVARFTMHPDQYMYVVYPDTEAQRKLVPVELFDDLSKQLAFMEEYRNRTGMHWRHYFGDGAPRPAPSLHMWTAEHIGQTHQVVSKEGFWKCKGSSEQCQSKTEVSLNLTVISQAPRAFHIPNFLSDFECDSIIHYAANRVGKSSVGNAATGSYYDATRTSRHSWLGRKAFPAMETIISRVANLLNLTEHTVLMNAEEMQVVHYINGQKYDPHHDWSSVGQPESRFITLLLYLTDQENPNAGGETSFPKADGGRGIKVRPVKGNAMLFYDLLEDGNGDDLSLHAALPVHEGQKWLANFWVWDPRR